MASADGGVFITIPHITYYFNVSLSCLHAVNIFTKHGCQNVFIMAALRSGCGHYIFVLWFLLSFFFFFPRLFSAVAVGCLSYFHTWCGLSANLECRSETCCTRLAENTQRKKIAKNRQLGTIAQLVVLYFRKHVSTIGKNLLNSNISSTCPHNMLNFGPLTAEIDSGVWGTPANFNGFRVLPSLLQRCRSPEANQTLLDVSPSPALVHYVYIFGGSCPDGILPGAKFTYVQVLRSPMSAALLQQRASAKLCGVVHGLELRNFRRRRHLYSAGRLSRWASAHILVSLFSNKNIFLCFYYWFLYSLKIDIYVGYTIHRLITLNTNLQPNTVIPDISGTVNSFTQTQHIYTVITAYLYKRLSCHRGAARRPMSVAILSTAGQL